MFNNVIDRGQVYSLFHIISRIKVSVHVDVLSSNYREVRDVLAAKSFFSIWVSCEMFYDLWGCALSLFYVWVFALGPCRDCLECRGTILFEVDFSTNAILCVFRGLFTRLAYSLLSCRDRYLRLVKT